MHSHSICGPTFPLLSQISNFNFSFQSAGMILRGEFQCFIVEKRKRNKICTSLTNTSLKNNTGAVVPQHSAWKCCTVQCLLLDLGQTFVWELSFRVMCFFHWRTQLKQSCNSTFMEGFCLLNTSNTVSVHCPPSVAFITWLQKLNSITWPFLGISRQGYPVPSYKTHYLFENSTLVFFHHEWNKGGMKNSFQKHGAVRWDGPPFVIMTLW